VDWLGHGSSIALQHGGRAPELSRGRCFHLGRVPDDCEPPSGSSKRPASRRAYHAGGPAAQAVLSRSASVGCTRTEFPIT
jgi:hypothetical protein